MTEELGNHTVLVDKLLKEVDQIEMELTGIVDENAAKVLPNPADGATSDLLADGSIDSILDDEENATDSSNVYDIDRFNHLIKSILTIEANEQFFRPRKTINVNALPLKEYLDATVIPILIQALEYLGTYRPPEPINALCVYLLKYRDEFEKLSGTGEKSGEVSEEPEAESEPEPEPEPEPVPNKKGKK